MKRFSKKQISVIYSIFDSYQDSFFHVSSDKVSINVFLGQYQFHFRIHDDYIYLAVYKYNQFLDNGQCFFRQHFNSFSTMMLSLQGFQMSVLS